MFDIKSFYEAVSVQDAIQALLKDTDAEIISGGTDVLIRVREGKDAGRSLVSIHNLEELKGVKLLEDGNLWIGAGTSFSHITNDPLIQEYIPMLGDAVDMVGGPQIRNTRYHWPGISATAQLPLIPPPPCGPWKRTWSWRDRKGSAPCLYVNFTRVPGGRYGTAARSVRDL